MIDPGKLDRRVTFLRRSTIAPVAGNERGGFAPLCTIWGGWRELTATQRIGFGYAEDVVAGELTVRECPQIVDVTAADRVRMQGVEYGIASVPDPDRTGFRKIRLERRMGS